MVRTEFPRITASGSLKVLWATSVVHLRFVACATPDKALTNDGDPTEFRFTDTNSAWDFPFEPIAEVAK